MTRSSPGKKLIKLLLALVCLLLAVVLIYVAYVFLSYHRIEDNLDLAVTNRTNESLLAADNTYTIVTNNLGFGAYTPDYTFFMDGGKSSRAASKESVEACTQLAAQTLSSLDADFILLQEVDLNSTRSYHVNQQQLLEQALPDYSSCFALNYHSAYLMYPLTEPHGASVSGLLTLSRCDIQSALRRSLPISTSFSKILDLDRGYSKSRIQLDNGKELVLYNTHMTAYGGSDEIRTGQMTMLFEDMQAEYEAGNYAICGGDYNHDLTGTSVRDLNQGKEIADRIDWAMPFPKELLPGNLHACLDYPEGPLVATCRDAGRPYDENNALFIIDGFLVSDNVIVQGLENIEVGFAYSDHQPVRMTFTLE